MLSDDFLQEIITNEEMYSVPVGCQSTVIHVIEDILERRYEENEYAYLSELLQ